ncbi:urease accessory protein UreD [Bordetella bronchialis]|uniref:Urease accessory protein UreD n=1 Tax=Bordetella bronchialis TaxID=463025 RepID=A0A193G110_9BORD|nr:urease accessory protein UreD [Bordetella bronchialis]ANN67821.1 urease accessory protein UreD [Bordetella bronchialis]ANN72914.1 urease accessory protein UreD [Bordetella bronchialis]
MDVPRPILDAPHAGGWLASLRLGLACRQGRTVLARRQHLGPLMVQKALYPEGDSGICHLTLLHPPGGLAAGDTLRLDIELEPHAHAVFSTPGATKWYKAHPRYPSRQDVDIRVGDGARLDWLPLENIFFDHSQACQRIDVQLGTGASALGWDAALLGRQAAGETWSAGQARTDFRLRDGTGRLLWAERQRLRADAGLREAPQGLGGLPAYGTLWAAGPACTRELAESLAPGLPFDAGLRAGATSPASGVLLVRAAAAHIEPLRRLFAALWLQLRPRVHGVPGRPLRLWAT